MDILLLLAPIALPLLAAAGHAVAGWRRTHLAARSSRPTGRARMGSPAPKRRRSSARAAALS